MEHKFILFAFNGDPMCVAHVWLNGLDMFEKGFDVKIVVEGSATKIIKTYHEDQNAPFRNLYVKIKEKGIITAVCKACATKMGSIEAAQKEELPIVGDMNGHPSMSQYIAEGYQIITF